MALPQQNKKKSASQGRLKLTTLTVVVMKKYERAIPRGKRRQQLSSEGRVRPVKQSRSMSPLQVKNAILRAFEGVISNFTVLESDQCGHNLFQSPKQDIDGEAAVQRRGCLYLCEEYWTYIGSQAGSHPSSDYPSSAATQTGTAVQHPASSSGGDTSSVNDMANPPLVKGQSSYSELEQKVSDLQKANQQYQQENHQFQEEKHYFQEECYKLEQEVVQQRAAAAQAELQCHREMENLQQRLDTALAEMQQLRPSPRTRVLVQDIDPWKVSRSEVQILSEMGRGAWGYVAKGRFRGQLVAVKSPHPEILDKHTTERLRREVSIMIQVRHPNLL